MIHLCQLAVDVLPPDVGESGMTSPGEDHAPWRPYRPERFARLRGLRVLVRDWLWLRRVGKR